MIVIKINFMCVKSVDIEPYLCYFLRKQIGESILRKTHLSHLIFHLNLRKCNQ